MGEDSIWGCTAASGRERVNTAACEATRDYSKGPGADRAGATALRAVLAGVAMVGAVVLFAAEFTTLAEVVVGSLGSVQRRVQGGDNHDHALLVLALATVAAAYGALRGGRPFALALVALGAAALLVALAVDLPDTRGSGGLPEAVVFEDARARAGTGLYLEIAGAVLVLLAGAALAVLDALRRRGG